MLADRPRFVRVARVGMYSRPADHLESADPGGRPGAAAPPGYELEADDLVPRRRPRERGTGMMTTAGRVLSVLLVDDDEGDLLMIQEALDSSAGAHEIHVVHDGQEALDFLR